MFGIGKNKFEEYIRICLDEVKGQRHVFDADVARVEGIRKEVYKDICQVMENTNDLAVYTMQNIEEESSLIHTIDEFSKELRVSVKEYDQLKEALAEQMVAVTSQVEENKHFTTPAKYLSEAPATLKQTCQTYDERLDEMAENGRKMGVLALNAAIEAGRLGDSGKQFVAAAEEIRQTAVEYEKTAQQLKEEVEANRQKIAEMEEVIMRMISLVKESNKGTTRVFKKCQDVAKLLQKSTMRDYSDDMISIRDKVVGIRNLDEEVAKCTERNKIQLSDIQEELQNQKKEMAEMESDLSHLLDTLEEQFD